MPARPRSRSSFRRRTRAPEARHETRKNAGLASNHENRRRGLPPPGSRAQGNPLLRAPQGKGEDMTARLDYYVRRPHREQADLDLAGDGDALALNGRLS